MYLASRQGIVPTFFIWTSLMVYAAFNADIITAANFYKFSRKPMAILLCFSICPITCFAR
jgi:hypothetical protein